MGFGGVGDPGIKNWQATTDLKQEHHRGKEQKGEDRWEVHGK
jgi:hypothetical protein